MGVLGFDLGAGVRPRCRPMAEMLWATAAGAGWPPEQGWHIQPVPCRAAGGRCRTLTWAQLWESVRHAGASTRLHIACDGAGISWVASRICWVLSLLECPWVVSVWQSALRRQCEVLELPVLNADVSVTQPLFSKMV